MSESEISCQGWELGTDAFHLTDPSQGRSWANYLSNGDYGLRLNQFASGYSSTLQEPRMLVTHHGWNQETKGRYVYLTEKDDPDAVLWNPGFLPCRTPVEGYQATHGLGWSQFEARRRNLGCESLHFLPRAGAFEIWRIRVVNRGSHPVRATVVAQAEFLLQASAAIDVPYYSWYQDVGPLADRTGVVVPSATPGSPRSVGFFRSLVRPSGFEGNLRSFHGTGDAGRPAAVLAAKAADSPGAGDPPLGCLRFDLDLEPGQVWETALFLGEGEAALEASRRLGTPGDVEAEWEFVRRQWVEKTTSRVGFQFGDAKLDGWLKGWLPYQIRHQSEGLVRTGSRGFRDAAQDSIGIGFYDLEASRRLVAELPVHQHGDGRCLRQWSLCGGADDERDFRDLPFWMVLAVFRYLEAGGDPSILSQTYPYLEAGEPETYFAHLRRGLEYVLQFGPHDLLLIGTGDWNDALSRLGPGGESLWLNQFAYLCLGYYDKLLERWGTDVDRAHGLDLEGLRERLYSGVCAGWTGQWFLRGYHESGAVLGGPERIFLLPQAWFTISGMGLRDPARASAALDAMVSRLDHPDGLLKCDPAFDAYDPAVGNLSALTPGMAENFAVYNHASTFGAYALFMAGRRTEALRYASRVLPYRKDAARTLAEPYVLVNYYNGGHYADHAGRGGISWLTGTANWLAMLLFDYIIPATVEWEPDEAERDG